ncbi:MAG: hypothetical protein WCP06_05855, partial [Verrucomicrobiota bacterium]
MRKFLIRAFWITVCLSVATVLWSLWYVNTRGFSKKWRGVLMAELEKRGVNVSIKRLTLNPMQGLVAKDVKVMTARRHGRVLANIDEIVLDINYSNLVHQESFLNAIDLRDATLSLPLEPGNTGNERLAVSALNARILLPPHQLYIAQAEADVDGLHISATGRLVNPEQFQKTSDTPDDQASPGVTQKARDYLKMLQALKLSGGNPILKLRVDGDFTQPSRLFAEAVLEAGKFTVNRNYTAKSVQVTARLADGLVRIDQCALTDERGALNASGTFRPATGETQVQLRSSLDLSALIGATKLAHLLDDCAFESPPDLELSGDGTLLDGEFHGKILGRIAAKEFTVKTIPFESASADFSWAGDQWFVHDARIAHRSGNVALSAMQKPGDFRVTLDSGMDLKALLPLLPEHPKDFDEAEFRTPPVVHLEGNGPSPQLEAMDLKGTLTVGESHYRGVAMKSVATNFSLKENLLTCRDIKLERAEGVGTGTVMFDLNTEVLQLLGVKTTLIPADVLTLFNRELARHVLPYRFKSRPALTADGSVDCRHGRWERNQLRIEVDGANGMDYVFLKKNLSASKIKGTVSIVGDRIKLDGLEAAIFGGKARGSADISLIGAKGDYTAEVHTEEIDFPSLTKLYFDFDTSKGKLDGSFVFSGKHDLAKEIKGSGKLKVTDGN